MATDSNSAARVEQSHMFREAAEAASVVAGQLSANREVIADLVRRLNAQRPGFVVTCSRGSSSTAATYGKYLIEKYLGIPTMPSALSINSLYQSQLSMTGALCLAISQSGASPDILAAATHARSCGALTVAITNNSDSPLARAADVILPLLAGEEHSVAATKTHLAAATVLAQMVAAWSGDKALSAALQGLPEAMNKAWSVDWAEGVTALRQTSSMYVIGRGLGLGAAQEAALKFKECCGIHAEALSAAEVRHGPMALLRKAFSIMVLGQNDESLDSVLAVAAMARSCQANLVLAVPGYADALSADRYEPSLEPILLTQSCYRLLVELAFARGFDPDTPMHLQKVTKTV